MVNRIACFLTCGYTEAGAMQAFLRKINDSFEYKQYLPNRTIKKKGDPKNISSSISGLTGEALLEKIYNILEKHSKEIAKCSAVLVEDDLDDRFFGWSDEQVNSYNQNIIDTIREKVGCDIPVFILYASPEIESWFVADWDNGFNYLYCESGFVTDVKIEARKFFVHHLKNFIDKEILGEYCDAIESYGVINGKYIKLSDQLIKAIQYDSKKYIQSMSGTNKEYVNQIVDSRCLYYSKKLHGDAMLRNVLPQNIIKKCSNYFRNTYYELQKFEKRAYHQ